VTLGGMEGETEMERVNPLEFKIVDGNGRLIMSLGLLLRFPKPWMNCREVGTYSRHKENHHAV
jgi:hypothetical protein